MTALIVDVATIESDDVSERFKTFLYANRRRASAIRLMDTDWPQAYLIRQMLVEYVGLVFEDGSHPLVFNAIDRGALGYEKQLGGKPDWQRLACFVDITLSNLSNELAGTSVISPRGHRWAPYSGHPLQGWLLREGSGEIRRQRGHADEGKKIYNAMLGYLEGYLPKLTREHCHVR